ncbi:hypothetical protein EJ04DRAFT_118906 [Polyplosphaeria fusca]|uniref:Secreted protein n=1 Tax=Polyplosphaeria fusca TaxID=682080 RepID=A0A9P4R6A6_9PLEO|nr:hypothetical protein EJ04DRAFT_118906 [Polyplosphaeria fusca]
MHTSLNLAVISFAALSVAYPADTQPPTWSAAPGSTVTCSDSDKVLSFMQGPYDVKGLVTDVCANLISPCLYKDKYPNIVCTQEMKEDWPITAPKTIDLYPNILLAGNKVGNKWALKFGLTPSPEQTDPVTWTKNDCEGYLTNMFTKNASDSDDTRAGCVNDSGSPGVGSVTIGGATTLKGTKIDISFVERTAISSTTISIPTSTATAS